MDGDIAEYLDRAPLAVSAADGAGPSPVIADFGADGSLTELHGRIVDNTLYIAVRGDMFNGADPNQNATILYIDCDSTSGTGAKRTASPYDLTDTGDAQRLRVSRSSFVLDSALVSQGVGFDAAVVLDGTSPLSSAIYGFGSAGVAGSSSAFANLPGNIAFAHGQESHPAAPGTTIAGPSAFEVAIPLSALGDANPRDMAFVVVTTSDEDPGFPSPNTLPENSQNTFDTVQTLDGVARFPSFPTVLINEVFNGSPDFAELYNPTASPVDLSDWSFRWADANGLSVSTPLTGFTLGASTYSILYDADGSLPTVPPGSKLMDTNIPANAPVFAWLTVVWAVYCVGTGVMQTLMLTNMSIGEYMLW
ncbi:MAG: lamin tail domain-containing protein, partial [Planctomycetes bacterium]|nr:lamin tail domain-containing protein [Planctomycetota bacterium]